VEKGYGIVVDYCGIAPELLAAFDRSTADTTVKAAAQPDELRRLFRRSLVNAERLLGADFDWRTPEVPIRASTELATDAELVARFRRNVTRAELIWETLGHDADLAKDETRFVLLLKILAVFGDPERSNRQLVLERHGAAVRDLLIKHTGDVARIDLPDLTLDADRIRQLLRELQDPAAVIEYVQNEQMLATLRQRLDQRLAGPAGAEYRSIADKLEHFASTMYVISAEGARTAVLDLAEIAKQLKELDERLGENWEEIDTILHGHRVRPHPAAVVNPATALQDLLAEFQPVQAPMVVERLAAVLDGAVERTSYRSLRDSTGMQATLRKALFLESKRLCLLPTGKADVSAFMDRLVDYVNTWML
jgi:hypothetical protein